MLLQLQHSKNLWYEDRERYGEIITIIQDMMEKNQIKRNLHKVYLDNLKIIMESARVSWIVDTNIRIANEKTQQEITNSHDRINDKIREIQK